MTPSSGARSRLRDHGIEIGHHPTGPLNAITDVPGVMVGHCTLIEGDRTRTGATAILPHPGNVFARKCPAGLAVLNGFGKFAGATQIAELGEIETPILLTNTLATGRAIEALIAHTLAQPGNESVTSINAVVGETNDSRLNDIRASRPTVAEMRKALDSAETGPVSEGAVGAGTGTVAFGLKGGIGTASRRVSGHMLGVLVQSNFGGSLRIDGRPVPHAPTKADADGSIVIVLATDAPLSAPGLTRLARRAFGGLARTGAALSHGSGDYALAFATPPRDPAALPQSDLSPFFEAAIEATEEAIVNSLLMALDMTGFDASRTAGTSVKALRLPAT
ncbi:P1 family peptidase [Roseovarius sp. SCSIO 43702]|uniref:P1 family peptidase n=1 Tax=Roseovarius sp. SCSIO 43702 TaxID=2823043 RepID=UPI001C7320C8|nr:P1 family peptidase [Roseovarius sp. SCSIO 43702]QYX56908.1 P1 family peptidase [Roseovarius sp. SCSIO 43702]